MSSSERRGDGWEARPRTAARRWGRAAIGRRRITPAGGAGSALAVSLLVHGVLLGIWVSSAVAVPRERPDARVRAAPATLLLSWAAEVRPAEVREAQPVLEPLPQPEPLPEPLPEPVPPPLPEPEPEPLPQPEPLPEPLPEPEPEPLPQPLPQPQPQPQPQPLPRPSPEPQPVPLPLPVPVPLPLPLPQPQPSPVPQPVPDSVAPSVALVRDPQPADHNEPPAYPSVARRRGWEGRVQLRVEVAADGSVTSVAVSRSSGKSALDRAAVAAVEDWTFEPATRGGQAVAGETDVSIRFQLDG